MPKILLEINEKEIPLNPLMGNMLKNIILGYLRSAKKVPDEINTIKIEIDLEPI
ncbi:MAG: hypothetical protein KGD63_09325 [Candidatus Lokiarchaeota archaeon]|nr:hypothetical protein [Candidatus Lokiarchaeota archaeon]